MQPTNGAATTSSAEQGINRQSAEAIEERLYRVQCFLSVLSDALCGHRPTASTAEVNPEHLGYLLGDLAERCGEIRAQLIGPKGAEAAR